MKNNSLTKELEHFFDQNLPQDSEAVRFDLRHKDVMLSANLIKAAADQKWPVVMDLLKQDADPRICRFSDGVTCESALYHALKAGQFKLARKLYKAGDRLDDLKLNDHDQLPAKVLEFLALEFAAGRDYFTDETKPLSECIRCGCWSQIREKMESASLEELDLSVEFIRIYLRNHNSQSYLEVLKDLKKHGANIDQGDFLSKLEELRKYPAVLQPAEEILDKMTAFVKEA